MPASLELMTRRKLALLVSGLRPIGSKLMDMPDILVFVALSKLLAPSEE
jgi:hypothetical protein